MILCAILSIGLIFLSVINETSSRLDTADLGMWRAAGLLLDYQGFVIPSNTRENANDGYLTPGESGMREDMIANALIWLLSKIINYAAYELLPKPLFHGANEVAVLVIRLIMSFPKIGAYSSVLNFGY